MAMKSIPLVVGSVPFGQYTLVFKKPKTFQIKKKQGKDGYYYEIGCKSLNILCFSRKLSDMREELYETIRLMWQEYAMADDSELSPKAILLKRTLLKTIEERRPVEDLYDSLSGLVRDAFFEGMAQYTGESWSKGLDFVWKSSVAYKRLKEIKKSLKVKG